MASQRVTDHDLRGLAYFSTMSEVYAWTEASVDPVQKSNTPLMRRLHVPTSMSQKRASNVLVLSDFANGYHSSGYDACQGADVQSEVYILEQWQRVEAFNYFTHNRVGIPPPTWVNAGHRNGALVLGTFIIERFDGQPHEETKLLLEKVDGKYKLADILARMAACYGFDGWLINVESTIASEDWAGGDSLKALLDQLKQGLAVLPSGGKVVW